MGSAVQCVVLVTLTISCSLLEAKLIRVREKAPCPLNNNCPKQCDFGFMKDDNSCDLCACKPNPNAVSCPETECPNHCANGYQQDATGCTLCECKSNVTTDSPSRQGRSTTCGPICLMYCMYGFKLDNDGCPVCECKTKEETCGTRRCKNYCSGGYKEDSRGCDTCECQSSSGSSSSRGRGGSSGRRKGGSRSSYWSSKKRCNNEQIKCAMYCPSGFKRDEQGCEICECKESAGHQPNSRIIESSSGVGTSGDRSDRSDATRGPKISCPRRRCINRCSHGYVKDTFGCDTCNCNSRSRSRGGTRPDPPTSAPKLCPICLTYCEHGFVEKSDGCFECKCKPAPAASPPLCRSCRMYCEHGFKQKPDGCDDCVCNDQPQ